MDIKKIKTILHAFSSQKVIVIGDVMIDNYIMGRVSRISPEAPVPVVSGLTREARLGGAANVLLNLSALGAQPLLVGVVGDDEKGKRIFQLLEEKKLSAKGLVIDESRQTTAKTRIISNNNHLLRVDDESEDSILEGVEKQIINICIERMKQGGADAIIFEDYDKGLLTPKVIKKVIEEARKRNIPVSVDPKKNNFHQYKDITLFKPNLKEFKEGLKLDVDNGDIQSLYEAGKTFIKKQGIEKLLLTMAEKGIFCCDDKGYDVIPAIEKLDVSDVSGAGDTVIAVAALCITSGLSLKETAWIANLAGGLVCEKAGVVPVDKEQLMKEMEEKR